MGVADFDQWATPNLRLPLRGRTYEVRPPSVGAMAQVLAAAALGEINLGLVSGPLSAEHAAAIASLNPNAHPALGEVYDELVGDGVDPTTIDRMAYYAVFYWARGQDYADALAATLWTPRDVMAELSEDEQVDAPKG